MKKILSLLLCLLFGFSIVLAGCGNGLENVTNNEKGIIYNGGSVALVSDYLFYANGFASDYSSMKEMNAYNDATKYASLNRIKNENISTATKYASSEKVESVSNGDLVGFGKTYTFAYGDNLYYVCPNTHRTNENKQAFDYLTVFKINYNGSNRKEIYTTKQAFDSTNGRIVALEYNDVAYIMIFDGANLVTIDITNGGNKVELSDVTSVAFPQENADWNGQVYYTRNAVEGGLGQGNDVYSIAVSGGEENKVTNDGENTKTVTFIGRSDDTAFYTISTSGEESSADTYILDCDALANEMFTSASEFFYPKTISNIVKVDAGTSYFDQAGYVFTVDGTVVYHNTASGNTGWIIDKEKYADAKVIAAVGTYVYFATTTGIYKVTTNDRTNVTKILDGMTFKTDRFGYTFNIANGENMSLKNIYFFATRVYAEDAKEEDKADTNVYLYQVSANGGEAVLLGKTI